MFRFVVFQATGLSLLLAAASASAQAPTQRDFQVPSTECLGFVLDAKQGLRPGDQILVDGKAVLTPSGKGRLDLDRDRLLHACRADGSVVQVVVHRAPRIAALQPR